MTSTEIILACTHPVPNGACEVTLCDGRKVKCCCECWNASVYARRAARKVQLDTVKTEARNYWQERGIAVGETVWTAGIGVFGPYRAEGVACVGAVGAYVRSKWQRGFLKADCFSKVS